MADTTEENVPNPMVQLTQWLADPMIWNWMNALDARRAADAVLTKMAELRLIEQRCHRLGGSTWIIDGQMFGRTDGVELAEAAPVNVSAANRQFERAFPSTRRNNIPHL